MPIVISGLPGTGEPTLAAELAARSGAVHVARAASVLVDAVDDSEPARETSGGVSGSPRAWRAGGEERSAYAERPRS